MFSKLRILAFLFCICVTQARAQNDKADSVSPKFVVDGFNFRGFLQTKDNGNYLYLDAFIVNYSDDTLKYWGTRRKFQELFEVTGSQDLQLVNQGDSGRLFEQMVIPPQRSQHINLRLLVKKIPEGVFELKISMKFYRWFNTNDFENDRKYHTPITLSDKVADSFHSDGDSFHANSIGDEKKYTKVLPPMELHLLTAAERAVLAVNVGEKKENAIDTIRVYKGANVIDVPVTVHNYGRDTLKYLSYTCSWEEYFHLDSRILKIQGFVCDYNIQCEITVPPGCSHTETLRVVYSSPDVKVPNRFRVGVNINKNALKLVIPFGYDYGYQFATNNIIWSNEVQLIPK
jgi:hypothetical protein